MSTEFARLFKAQTPICSGRSGPYENRGVNRSCAEYRMEAEVLAEIAGKMVYRLSVLKR